MFPTYCFVGAKATDWTTQKCKKNNKLQNYLDNVQNRNLRHNVLIIINCFGTESNLHD